MSVALDTASGDETVQDKTAIATALRHHWKLFVTFVAGILIICLLLIWWGKPGGTDSVAKTLPTPTTQPNKSSGVADEATKAAILDTLTQYNRAETEADALLTITPLQPLLHPNSPLAQRRAAQLIERQKRQAPHRTMLVRWAIGEITVAGKTATVVTQETWSNQEAGAVTAEQATVRVTYTLQWDEAAGRWLIADSSQTAL